MERLTLKVEGEADKIERGGRWFISFECLGRSWTETGRIQTMVVNTIGRPIPFYQEKPLATRYIELKHVERIFDFDLLIVNGEGIKRPSLQPDGTSDPRYMTSMRRKLLADDLWTDEEKAVREKQKQKRVGKRIINPPLQLPEKDEGPVLFEDDQQYVTVQCTSNMINTLLRHDKSLRPSNESTARQRKKLIARQGGECQICHSTSRLKDEGRKTEVDHKSKLAPFVDAVMTKKLTLQQAFDAWWDLSNLRAVHTACNKKKSDLSRKHEREEREAAS